MTQDTQQPSQRAITAAAELLTKYGRPAILVREVLSGAHNDGATVQAFDHFERSILSEHDSRVEKLEAALNAWRETSSFVEYDENGIAHVLSETEAVKRARYQGGDVQMAVQATFRALNGGSDAE